MLVERHLILDKIFHVIKKVVRPDGMGVQLGDVGYQIDKEIL